MLKHRVSCTLIAATLLASPLLVGWQVAPAAPAAPAAGKYLAADAIDVRALLPDPPAPHSPVSDGEIDIVLAAQADAAPASVARAASEDAMVVWLFADVLGRDFNASKMPKTAAFLKQIERDSKAVSDRAKAIWSRPRPYEQNPAIRLQIEKPGNNSYPSGHSTRAAVWAETLALFAPEKAEAIRARARLIGLDRIILGVHFPSDVAAGYSLGRAVTEAMKKDPAFQKDLEEARSEWKP
ncbi:MAG: phosphatase PAP2 family protein [Phycisphaerales bacterium]|nr:phosphatase PAP2 family protein [Planctomycetota bacterium]